MVLVVILFGSQSFYWSANFGGFESLRLLWCLLYICLIIKVPVILALLENSLVIRVVMLWVNRQGPAEIFAHVKQHLYVKMEPSVNALTGSTKAGLARIWVDQLELSPHHHTTSGLFRFVDRKWATVKTEVGADSVEHFWKYLLFKTFIIVRIIRTSATVHENILLSRVPMKVAV